MNRYVIVGAGPAGVIAAETLRDTDPAGDVTLIGDEPERPYSRMAIPYLLIGKIGEEGTHLRKAQTHYDSRGIRVLRDRVERVDAGARRLFLASGGAMDYDRLLVCTGSRPLRPPVPGIDLPGVHTCWTLDDARHIAARAAPGARVVLVGAGFVGCIVLEALALRGVHLTVLEMGDRMVPRMMNPTAGGLIKRWCEGRGVRVLTSTRVAAIRAGAAAPLQVVLDGGEVLDADLVVSAAGVAPNVEFLQGCGIDRERGLLIDHHLQTSVPGIYAAGDVAQGRDFSTGGLEVHAIQPTASEHGRIAALNMAGVPTEYRGSFNMNVLDTLGLISSSFGLWMGVPGGESVEMVDAERFRYLQLQFDGERMVGATAVGLTQHVGVLRGLIQGGVRLGPWKAQLLRDPLRLMEAWLARNFTAQAA
ncbi:pyridine nucleotide-disulfide oxidoreductase [Plasticicumulans lactativorans]|uniref:Pyridine nucleotide-disulfide oxidoreductase n=1 Tax=Plasticicumulans lactativorans TaxID=1133106 RepID=A0A4R2LLT0_9GAMM|nr:FAD-dependent oxidoreductase [Plasticicumulans lactativorans]TCO80385.1 pyridine nucleotide-disulfide oxidoreductase [Plasticicumulans lactativorans]